MKMIILLAEKHINKYASSFCTRNVFTHCGAIVKNLFLYSNEKSKSLVSKVLTYRDYCLDFQTLEMSIDGDPGLFPDLLAFVLHHYLGALLVK